MLLLKCWITRIIVLALAMTNCHQLQACMQARKTLTFVSGEPLEVTDQQMHMFQGFPKDAMSLQPSIYLSFPRAYFDRALTIIEKQEEYTNNTSANGTSVLYENLLPALPKFSDHHDSYKFLQCMYQLGAPRVVLQRAAQEVAYHIQNDLILRKKYCSLESCVDKKPIDTQAQKTDVYPFIKSEYKKLIGKELSSFHTHSTIHNQREMTWKTFTILSGALCLSLTIVSAIVVAKLIQMS